MNLDNYLEDIKQVALKNRVWYIATIVTAVILMLTVMIFWRPKVNIDIDKLNLFQKQNSAYEYQNRALRDLVIAQQKSIDLRIKKDSLIVNEVMLNRNAVLTNREIYLKNENHKKDEINRINTLTDSQLAGEVAEIVRQYKQNNP